MNRHLAFLTLLLFMPSLRAEGGELPATLSVEGKGPLTLRARICWAPWSCTRSRSTWTGARSRAKSSLHRTSKALRIQVSYEEDLRRKLAIDWRRELVPRLDSAATAHIQGSFAPIQHGDTVIVEYVPGRGTTVRVNRGVAVSGANHDLMLAFLDHWIGQRPLSEEIKHALLSP